MIALQDLRAKVEPIVRDAGDILLSYFHTNLIRTEKQSGFVTEADLASERFLMAELHKVMPEAAFFAEESGKSGNSTDDYCWVIDPLDGTTNFAHGLPYFCISVALTFKGKPVFGCIYQPLLNEFFYASQGNGAYLNGERIQVSAVRSLQESLLLVGFPYAKGEHYQNVLNYLRDLSKKTYAFRHFGAVALDQAYLACGRSEVVFFEQLGWWDVAAGIILIQEAGGVVSTYQGRVVDAHYESFLAANQELHVQMLTLFAK